MYCKCKGGGRVSGYSSPAEGNVWVHSDCGLIPHFVFDRITNMMVPYHAKFAASVYSTATGHNYVTFILEDDSKLEVVYFHPYPFKDAVMTEQRDVLLKFWQDLDVVIDQIKTLDALDADLNQFKVKATTYAEVIAYLMHRYYEDSTAVLREAQARWLARQDGTQDHQTPGLAEALWDPQTRWNGTPYSESSEARVRSGGRAAPAAPKHTGNTIPDSAVESWKKGISQGMFTVDQCAKTYAMTSAEVKAQLGLA